MPRKRPVEICVTRIYTGAKSKQEIINELRDIYRNTCMREGVSCKPHTAPDAGSNLSTGTNGSR